MAKKPTFEAGKRGKTYGACECCGSTRTPGHKCPPGMSKAKGSKRG